MQITIAEIRKLSSELLREKGLELTEDDWVVGSSAKISSLEAVQLIALIESFLEDRGIDYIDVFELVLSGGECTIGEIASRVNGAIDA